MREPLTGGEQRAARAVGGEQRAARALGGEHRAARALGGEHRAARAVGGEQRAAREGGPDGPAALLTSDGEVEARQPLSAADGGGDGATLGSVTDRPPPVSEVGIAPTAIMKRMGAWIRKAWSRVASMWGARPSSE